MNVEAWKLLEEDRANKQPTPPIPSLVTWYQHGDPTKPHAGIVTGHGDRAGRLNICILAPGAFPQHRKGVYHVTSKYNKPHVQTIKDTGTWDYPPGTKIPAAHYAVHDEEIAKREKNLLEAEEKAKQVFERVQVKRERTELGAA